MKKITLKTWLAGLVMFYSIFCNSQVTVSMDYMSYNTGGSINLGNAIEVPFGNDVTINFTVSLNKPNNQVTGNSTLRLFLKNSYGSNIQVGSDEFICNLCWTTSHQSSKSIIIESSQLNNEDGYLYAEFESASGVKYKSTNWQISILPQPITNNTISGNQTLNSGAIASNISGSTPTGGNGTYSYQWKKKTTGSWSTMPGTNSKNYSPGTLTATTKYHRIVSSGGLQSTSNTVTKTVNSLPPISNNTISFNGNNLFSGSTPSGGNGTYNYQWEGNSNGNWSAISGATSKNYSLQSPVWIKEYRRVVSSNGLENISNITTLATINNNTISFNGSNTIIGSTPSGGYGNFTYVWYTSLFGSDPQPTLNTNKDLVLAPTVIQFLLNANAYFYRQVTSGYIYSNSNGENLYSTSTAKSSTLLAKSSNSNLTGNVSSYSDTKNQLSKFYLDTKIISNKENSYKIYPSPFSETINFDLFYLNNTFVEIYLYSKLLTRKLTVFKGNIRAGEKSISYNIPSNYPTGLYIYEIIENGIRKSGKLIKQ